MLHLFALAAALACAHALVTPADVAAGVARASTPYKPDRPVSQAAAAAALAAFGGDLAAMWAQATAHDSAHPASGPDCRAFLLQYELSLRLMPERAPLSDVFDALRLGTDCGVTAAPTAPASTAHFAPLSAADIAATCSAGAFFVDAAAGSDAAAGTQAAPFATLPRALQATRAGGARGAGQTACIVLRAGVHHLPATQALSAGDSGLVVTALAGDAGPAWVSGGVPLGALAWAPHDLTQGRNVYVADIAPATPLGAMLGLNTLDASAMPTRLWRAMYPNYDIEQFSGQLPGMRELVGWVKAPIMPIPELIYKDLKAMGLKNDSTMTEYNVYAAGRGGPCEHWDRDGESWAYVCSNSTAGGWEFIEQNFATSGQLGFPIAMRYNQSQLPSFAAWTMPSASPSDWANSPRVTAWHNQGWFQATYAVTAMDTAQGELTLTADGVYPSGGWQGGRTMESCSAYNTSFEAPLCSGPWFITNVFQELDAPGEYFFDPTARKLYLYYNASSGTPPPADYALVASALEVFFNLSGTPAAPVSDVTFAGLGLRDQRNGQLERCVAPWACALFYQTPPARNTRHSPTPHPHLNSRACRWVDPSGGDWGLRRAGLFHLEGTARVNITGCTFYRTDANAVMIAGFNRNASVVDSEFAYTGMSAVVTFGRTLQDDGSNGEQPFGTLIAYNKVHEMGAYQLQSSAWFTSRATLTRAEGLVVFNIPRAAINFNDGFGGGNNVTGASIFNTCRSSSDHGPMCVVRRSARAALCLPPPALSHCRFLPPPSLRLHRAPPTGMSVRRLCRTSPPPLDLLFLTTHLPFTLHCSPFAVMGQDALFHQHSQWGPGVHVRARPDGHCPLHDHCKLRRQPGV